MSFFDFDLIHLGSLETTKSLTSGANAQRFLIIIDKKESERIDFLAKIVKAMGIDMATDTVLLRKPEHTPISFAQLKQLFQPKFTLVFGLAPSSVGIHASLPNYELSKVNDCTFLVADSLETLQPDKRLKTRLWTALQKLQRQFPK